MGADLYISQLFDPQFSKWRKRFEKAITERDGLPEYTSEWEEAQKRAEECFQRMYERGYFRDSYNDSNLLNKFDLSWKEVIPMLNDKHQLTPEKASALLAMLKARAELFEGNLASEQEPARRYFRHKYEEFKAFLNTAIQLGAPIECSL
jgi:hypothetical protein